MKESIKITWHYQDVLDWDRSVIEDGLIIDDPLTKDQACMIIEALEDKHDSSIGINWDTIDYHVIQIRDYPEIYKKYT
jgi:hypothetical protein